MGSAKIGDDEAVNVVRWRPGKDAVILSAAAGEDIYLLVPPIVDPETEATSRELLDAGFGYATNATQALTANGARKEPVAKWTRPGSRLEDEGVLIKITVRTTVKVISWHRRGDFFSTVSPTAQKSAVAIHTLSKHLTQIPFRRLPGIPQTVQFHPSRPLFFVATQRTIRSYDLQSKNSSRSSNLVLDGSRLSASIPEVTISLLVHTIDDFCGTIWTCLPGRTRL